MSKNRFIKKVLLFMGLIVISQLSIARYAGYLAPSNPDEKRYSCTKSYGCTATGKISYWDYMYYRYGPKGPYKNYKYTQFKILGKCTSSYKGRYLFFAGTSAKDISSWNSKYCKGPIKNVSTSGGSGGSGPLAPFDCPNFHKNGTTRVEYSSNPLCCSPLHSVNKDASSNIHK